MGLKVTVLRSQRHSKFLAAQRQDPVTRKVFTAGDRLTLCAACLLPFLEESWDGVGGTHCGQSAAVGLDAFQTMASPPAEESADSPGADAAEVVEDALPEAVSSDTALELRPIPCGLHEVLVRLRG